MGNSASKWTHRIVLGVALVPLSAVMSCAAPSATTSESASASTAPVEESSADELADAKRKLANAKKKLDAARLRSKQAEADDKAALKRLGAERALAEAELKQFDEQDAPNRLAHKRLETQNVRDQFADDQEELKQLEMMYAAEDLADQTKDIVLKRGKRRLGRSQERLAIEERELDVFEKFTLPRERSKLELEVTAKTRAVEAEKSGFAITKLEKQVEISDAEGLVKECEAKLQRIEQRQPKPSTPEPEPAPVPAKVPAK